MLRQIIIYPGEDGYWVAECLSLPGCISQGKTKEEAITNVKEAILHYQVLTPLDLEEVFGLTEGNIYHGELMLDQLFIMRPVPGWAQYRAPIQGLYLCGAGTHPGGGVTGVPGYNAAREVLKDVKR